MNRIKENEKRLDDLSVIISNLSKALDDLNMHIDDYYQLNEYYGSKKWFKDKDAWEKGTIPKVKAGVLSEDVIWNLDEEITEQIDKMKRLVEIFQEKKNN